MAFSFVKAAHPYSILAHDTLTKPLSKHDLFTKPIQNYLLASFPNNNTEIDKTKSQKVKTKNTTLANP